MKTIRTTILLFLASTVTTGLLAQSYTFKESEPTIKGPQHEILLCPDGDYLTITYPYEDDKDPVIITRFDTKLSQRYNNAIQDLSSEHFRAAVYENDRLFLLCSNKEGAINRYEVNAKAGTLTGSPVSLFELEAKEEDATFFSGVSHDKNFHYFLAKEHKKKEKGDILQGVILDRQMNKIAAFSYTTSEDRDNIQHYDYVLSDNGTLSLIYNVGVNTKKDEYTPYIYTIVQVDAKGKTNTMSLSGLPNGDLQNLSWTPENNQLLFTGLLSLQKKVGFTVILSGSFDPATKKTTDLRQTEVNTLLTKAPDFMNEIRTKGIPSQVALLKTIPLSDGSKAMLLEVNSDRFYQSHYAPAMQNSNPAFNKPGMNNGPGAFTSSYSVTYHNRGDVYVLKLDRNNNPQWLDLVAKQQEEADLVITIGIACTTDSKNNIHIFFYDNRKNTESNAAKVKVVSGTDHKSNVLACVSVAPDGAMKKQFIDPEDAEFQLMPEKSVAETSNELCFMAIKSKKAFTATHLFNHASYRLSTAMIK